MVADGSPSPSLAVRVRAARGGFTLDATFDVPPGVTLLHGPSGAGKSTTLAAIAGILRPSAGRVALGAEVWFDLAASIDVPVQRRRVALVFQQLALFPHMTALGNVEYGVSRQLDRPERLGRALEMLERMKVASLAHRRPATFSGGEAQRVALARAFAMEPRVLLLDEAFSAMDQPLRLELLAEVRRYVEERRLPAIAVTHQIADARALGDRAVLLAAGRVTGAGDPREMG